MVEIPDEYKNVVVDDPAAIEETWKQPKRASNLRSKYISTYKLSGNIDCVTSEEAETKFSNSYPI